MPITIRLTGPAMAHVAYLAGVTNRPMVEIAREAIEEYYRAFMLNQVNQGYQAYQARQTERMHKLGEEE